MNEQNTTQYMIPPPVEQLASSLGVVTGMLKETRDFLADTLNRNQQLSLENAGLKKENVKLRQENEERDDANEALVARIESLMAERAAQRTAQVPA